MWLKAKGGYTGMHALEEGLSIVHLLFLFLLSRLQTNCDFIRSLLKYLKQGFCITTQFCQTVSTHSEIVHPEQQDVLAFCRFFCYGVVYLQSSFLADCLTAATTGYSIEKSLTIKH